jgi:hypothetical protein
VSRLRIGCLAALLLVVVAAVASTAGATVRISRAELSGTRLRIEGTALPNAVITVDGVALGTSDSGGNFRVEKDPFTTPDCIVDVNDGSSLATPVSLSGCSPATTPPPPGAVGSISIIPGGNGHGTITSQPAGINCVIAATGVSGPCSAFFPAGAVVRLDARPAADSQFQGWRGLPGCFDPSKITIFANTTISCQPGLQLKF